MRQRSKKLATLCITATLLTTANVTPAAASELEYNKDVKEAESRDTENQEKEAEVHAGLSSVTAWAAEVYQSELEAAETAREEEIPEVPQEEESPELAVAQVENYINVRNQPSTEGEVIGKLYNDSVGEIIGEEAQGEWLLIRSGNVEGYIKAEYALRGEEGQKKAEEVGTRYARVTAVTLRLRQEATTESDTVALLPEEEVLPVSEEVEGWAKVTGDVGEGYISTEYAQLYTEHKVAESREEEEARLLREEEERQAAEAASQAQGSLGTPERNSGSGGSPESGSVTSGAPGSVNSVSSGSGDSGTSGSTAGSGGSSSQAPAAPSQSSSGQTSNSSLGQSIASFALKFVGNPYVYGGTSLTNGADCSGFVQSVYANFGISLPRTSGEQGNCGTNVGGLENARPGDLVSYSGHIGIYIGNGQIVHASAPKTGIKVSNASYRPILSVRRLV